MEFADTVVLVTGATSGIGRACVERFARAGARVVATGRRLERLRELAAALGPRVHGARLDLRDPAGVAALVPGLPAEFRAVSVLINNAGLALGDRQVIEGSPADWDQMIDTNIKGLLHMTRAVLPGMMERDEGHIFNVSSVGGTYPSGSAVYGATKAFVSHISLVMRAELLGRRIRVTAVEPGSVASEFNVVKQRGDEDKARAVHRGYEPMAPSDVAEAIFQCHCLPANVNVNRIELMPIMQAPGPFAIKREP